MGVKALPKDAVVEKQVLVHTARIPVTDEDDGEVTMEDVAPMYRHGMVLHWLLWSCNIYSCQTRRLETNGKCLSKSPTLTARIQAL